MSLPLSDKNGALACTHIAQIHPLASHFFLTFVSPQTFFNAPGILQVILSPHLRERGAGAPLRSLFLPLFHF